MKKVPSINNHPRDASLRVSNHVRDSLKAAAAVMGRPLYEVTNEAMERYLARLKLPQPGSALRKRRATKGA